MRLSVTVMVMVVATASAACGLYEDVPPFGGDVLEEGDPCGPCELGTYGANSCNLGQLEGAVDENAACDAVIFVDAQSGSDDEASGGQEKPFATLQAAVEAGNERNARVVIVGGDDVHEGPVELGDGLSILGGFTREWQEDLGIKPAVRVEASDSESDSWAVLAEGIQRPTILRNLRIETRGTARTHYGMRVVDSQGLVLERVRIEAAEGRDGAAGEAGAEGNEGSRGKNAGTPGRRDEGAAGANAPCSEANGGAGGRGALESANGSQQAEAGEMSSAGVSGGAISEDGNDGESGAAGDDGSPGAEGAVDGGRWVLGGAGEAGANGESGRGGSGGGGGAVPGGDGIGGGGGGGGAGGCGGEGGTGGEPGGASFGVLVVDSTLVVLDADIVSSDGGDGGVGGVGGAGGAGGDVGFGMDGEDAGRSGGDGGRGGEGGRGGNGGPGRGGVSYGMFCAGDVTVAIESSEMRSGNGGLMGGGSEERASSGESEGCDI